MVSRRNRTGFVFGIGLATAVVIVTILFTGKQQSAISHAAGSSSQYPANIEYDGDSAYGTYIQSNLTNPNIGAVDINMNWINGEPQQGSFNWGPADTEMAAWASHGKKFTLVIRYIYELAQSCSGGKQGLPAYEIARIPNFCSAKGDVIPDFFNPTFKADLIAYVTAVANHIAASPYKNNLEYVRVGLGAAGEPYACLGCSATDLQTLNGWGYSITNWASWQKEMLSAFKNAFSYTNVIYPLGDNDVDPATGQPVSVEVGYWAAANGMGVGQQGLANTTGYANGQAVQIAKYVRSHYPNAYVQFQTNTTESSAANVQGDATIANSAGAFSVEWYANNSADPTYQSIFAAFQKMVDARTCPSGCVTPTQSPSQSITSPPTNPISQGASPTPSIAAGSTPFAVIVCPHGLGNCGDNVSPSGGNTSPLHQSRSVTLTALNSSGQPAGTGTGNVQYNQTAQNFQGTISVPGLSQGQYLAAVKMDGFLSKQVSGIFQVNPQAQAIPLPSVSIVAGNINNDTQLDILDYNILIGCFGSKLSTSSCTYPPTTQSPAPISTMMAKLMAPITIYS